MKNKEKVAELIAALKAEAENDFELHRISVLEKDLLEGMPKVEILNDKHQTFQGNTYNKVKGGRFLRNESIHRTIYEYYFGKIPQGYEIHHIDFDPSNNKIDNLQCVTSSKHHKIHNEAPEKTFKVQEYSCIVCGKKFTALKRGTNFYCSRECKEKARIQRYGEERKCECCGKIFVTLKYSNQRFCSLSCVSNGFWAKNKKDKNKVCECCGTEFTATHKMQRFCSKSCSSKFNRAKLKK